MYISDGLRLKLHTSQNRLRVNRWRGTGERGLCWARGRSRSGLRCMEIKGRTEVEQINNQTNGTTLDSSAEYTCSNGRFLRITITHRKILQVNFHKHIN